jgi:hypothetical protein
MKSPIIIFSSLLSMFTMAACIGKDEMRWREEVLLHDDKAIIIERSAVRIKSGFPDSRRGKILSQEIRYAPQGFVWSSPATEQPLSFDIIDGYLYFVAIPSQDPSIFCLEKKRGAYVALFYRWENGKLGEIEQRVAPIDILRMNISGISQWGYSKKYDPTYLSMQDVNQSNGIPRDWSPPTLRTFFEEKQKNYLLCQ